MVVVGCPHQACLFELIPLVDVNVASKDRASNGLKVPFCTEEDKRRILSSIHGLTVFLLHGYLRFSWVLQNSDHLQILSAPIDKMDAIRYVLNFRVDFHLAISTSSAMYLWSMWLNKSATQSPFPSQTATRIKCFQNPPPILTLLGCSIRSFSPSPLSPK